MAAACVYMPLLIAMQALALPVWLTGNQRRHHLFLPPRVLSLFLGTPMWNLKIASP
jgi:hypothetical protein